MAVQLVNLLENFLLETCVLDSDEVNNNNEDNGDDGGGGGGGGYTSTEQTASSDFAEIGCAVEGTATDATEDQV